MKNRVSGILILVILLVLTGCSVFKSGVRSEKKELEYNLKLWDSFHMDGIVEITYQAFSFRKNYAINKDGDKFNLTVFNAGLMGLNPKPLLKVVYEDSLTIDTSGLAGFSDSIPGNMSIDELPFDLSISKYLLPMTEEIILNKKAVIKDLEFAFNEKMQISSIGFDEKARLNFEYDLQGLPSTIFAVYNGKKLLTLNIDNFKKQ
jgi:hypothetical protein